MQVNYQVPSPAVKAVTPITIQTTETVLMTVTDGNFIRQSQLTAYYNITLGSATSVKIRYYMTPDKGVTWYQVPIKDKTTAVLVDTPSVIDATSPTQSGAQMVIEDIPLSGATGYKITAQSVAASATLNFACLFVRDN